MKRTALSASLAAILSLTSAAALAHSCPKVMKVIDSALPSATLSAAQMDEVKKLRAEGEAQHKAGNHDGAMAALEKAKTILGIK